MGTLHILKSTSDAIFLSLIFCDGGKTVVFDGGFPQESEALADKLNELGSHVDLWILTHPHDDHIGAISQILENHPEITIDNVCYHFPSCELVERYESQEQLSLKLMRDIPLQCEKRRIKIVTPSLFESYSIGNSSVTCLRLPDLRITNNFVNNASTVWRIESNGKRILVLGDLGFEAGEQMLETLPAAELKSDYVQMAHHGQNGVGKSFYQAVDPDYCIWGTPSWLWDNLGKGGYDTGPFKTVIVRGWMSEIGIQRHFVDKDAPFTITL